MENKDFIIVTNWEQVEKDDFYLTNEWTGAEKDELKTARKLQKEGRLYFAYIVAAVDYAIYYQMDAQQVFIDDNCSVVMYCESQIISDNHKHKERYDQ